MRVIPEMLGHVINAGDMPMYTERATSDYSEPPPILIGASSDAAMARAVRSVEASGYRIGDCVTIGAAQARIEQQIAASAIWLELDDDGGSQMDRLLDCLRAAASDGRFPAVVAATTTLIDLVDSRIGDTPVQLVIDGSDAERAAALLLAVAEIGMGRRLSDVATDQSAARLKQLSDEVNRIAATLAQLSANPAPSPGPILQSLTLGDAPEVSAEVVRSVIRARRLRSRYFS
jgi:hypothetical protein